MPMLECRRHKDHGTAGEVVVSYPQDELNDPEGKPENCPICFFLERPNREHERVLMRLWNLLQLDPEKKGQSRARRAVAFALLDKHADGFALDGRLASYADYETDAAAVDAYDEDD